MKDKTDIYTCAYAWTLYIQTNRCTSN